MMAQDQQKDRCEVTIIHDEIVEQVQRSLLPHEQIIDLASLFQALSEPTRVRIIHILIQEEMCVCDIAAVLEMNQSAISHQLRFLRNLHLIKWRKVGKMVYYSIDDEHILTLFETGLSHVSHRQ
jgi:DNA-binding transcriptional ArsR family regulator